MKSINFSLEESQLIIEALLFAACTDVCSDHTEAHRAKMLELASNLNTKFDKPGLHNIFLFKDNPIEDKEFTFLVEAFPNLPLQDIIAD